MSNGWRGRGINLQPYQMSVHAFVMSSELRLTLYGLRRLYPNADVQISKIHRARGKWCCVVTRPDHTPAIMLLSKARSLLESELKLRGIL